MDCSFLKDNQIIPVVVFDSLDEAEGKLNALARGGINIAEITFRTECAEDSIKLAVRKLPNMLIGAGTVINADQCERAIAAGAKFVVSPGLGEDVCQVCKKYGVPYIGGVVTPTEIMRAKAMGMNTVKFFPAGASGGIEMLKAMSAAFPDVKFVPTGGIGEENMSDYLAEKFVAAIGGSWMMKGDYAQIERLSAKAVQRLKEMKL